MCRSIIIDEHNDRKNNNISQGLLSTRASPWKGFLRKSGHVASEQLQAPKKKKKMYHEPSGCHFCFSSGILFKGFAVLTSCSGEDKSAVAICPDVYKNFVRRTNLHGKCLVQIGRDCSGAELASLILFQTWERGVQGFPQWNFKYLNLFP